jgi:HAD superfamily hydrolase (TIGR01490 family)
VAGIAFFDVDKTLLAVNSATLWVRRELRNGNITRLQALRASFWVGLYGLGLIHADDVIRAAVQTLKGKRERDVLDRTLEFWDDEVKHTIRPGAREAVRRHKERGELTFLLTSSSNYLSAPIADLLQVDGFLANRFVVEDGVFTGEAHEPVCYGKGKVAHAAGVAQKLNCTLEESTFYTDSLSDLPMLEAVGHPVVVDPDVRLRRLARRRGWPVEDWGVPGVKLLAASTPPAIPPPPPPPPA